jgi:hypothetical protein
MTSATGSGLDGEASGLIELLPVLTLARFLVWLRVVGISHFGSQATDHE